MPRPHRPNPLRGTDASRADVRAAHVKQETASERKERLRDEAEIRHAEHRAWKAAWKAGR